MSIKSKINSKLSEIVCYLQDIEQKKREIQDNKRTLERISNDLKLLWIYCFY